jgi:hypothetical protein
MHVNQYKILELICKDPDLSFAAIGMIAELIFTRNFKDPIDINEIEKKGPESIEEIQSILDELKQKEWIV